VNVGGYRFAVRSFIPRIAYAVTILHRKHEPADAPSPELAEMEKELAVISADNDWESYRRKAGIGTYTLAGLLYILPKVGPIKFVAVKGPTAATEAEYIHSVSVSAAGLRRVLGHFTPPPATNSTAVSAAAADVHSDPAPGQPLPESAKPSQDLPQMSNDPRHPLLNRDLDTGLVVKPGGYSLTDATYADLLHRLVVQNKPIPPAIKTDILAYYADPNAPITTKKFPQRWAQVQADLATLQGLATSDEPAPYPTYGTDADTP
jgi:hypothetical protein